MTSPFTASFKQQAVEKALGRPPGVTLDDLAEEWGIGRSTVQRWMRESRAKVSTQPEHPKQQMNTEKRPQDWSADEKLRVVIACGSLDDKGMNEFCREHGIYPHHIEQWKAEFIEGTAGTNRVEDRSEAKQLKHENKELKKELRRKEKALAETAALLVLQKKVDAMWGNDEDNSP